jgi:oligo-1,6-glucosidase
VESAKLLATILHLQRGTPFLYQGDELGMTNFPFTSIEQLDDIESRNYFHESVVAGQEPADVLARLCAMSRDNARTPMQWDGSEHAGFTTGEPWLQVNPNWCEVNAARQVGVPGSVFEHHRALIALRHEEPAVVNGVFALLVPDDDQLFAFTRRDERTELVVVANFSGRPAELPGVLARRVDAAELVLGDSRDAGLRPWESRVYRHAAL